MRPIQSQKKNIRLRILGVMTGTSCDGLDAACVEITNKGWGTLWKESLSYPRDLRKRVLICQAPGVKLPVQDWMNLHRDLGEWYGKSLKSLIKKHPRLKPDLIANHGQTTAHFPPSGSEISRGATLQLGNPSYIASCTGITVCSNFREGDMSAGGQGAPLAPLFHKILASSTGLETGGISIHNLGGISNLTYLSPEGEVIAFDTGPANLWIDAATYYFTKGQSHFDKGGRLARSGEVDFRQVSRYLEHPFFKRPIPKSTGRDDFPLPQFTARDRRTAVPSATLATAQSIANAYKDFILKRKWPLHTIYFCGGGARNQTLLQWISEELPGTRISTIDELQVDSQYIEALAFAWMGFLAILGHPVGGSWTGVKGFAPPAHIIPGQNWQKLLLQLEPFIDVFPFSV